MNVLRTIQPLRPPKPSLSSKRLERYISTIPSLPPELQPIIGLEIHVQLKTRRKLFSCTSPFPAHPVLDHLAYCMQQCSNCFAVCSSLGHLFYPSDNCFQFLIISSAGGYQCIAQYRGRIS